MVACCQPAAMEAEIFSISKQRKTQNLLVPMCPSPVNTHSPLWVQNSQPVLVCKGPGIERLSFSLLYSLMITCWAGLFTRSGLVYLRSDLPPTRPPVSSCSGLLWRQEQRRNWTKEAFSLNLCIFQHCTHTFVQLHSEYLIKWADLMLSAPPPSPCTARVRGGRAGKIANHKRSSWEFSGAASLQQLCEHKKLNNTLQTE